MEQQPSIGRIVHFSFRGEVSPAIITHVYGDLRTVDLAVFPRGAESYSGERVGPESNGEVGWWFWPPRV